MRHGTQEIHNGAPSLANIKIQNKLETASAAKVHKRVKFVKLR
jgi:hypothetical protein